MHNVDVDFELENGLRVRTCSSKLHNLKLCDIQDPGQYFCADLARRCVHGASARRSTGRRENMELPISTSLKTDSGGR